MTKIQRKSNNLSNNELNKYLLPHEAHHIERRVKIIKYLVKGKAPKDLQYFDNFEIVQAMSVISNLNDKY